MFIFLISSIVILKLFTLREIKTDDYLKIYNGIYSEMKYVKYMKLFYTRRGNEMYFLSRIKFSEHSCFTLCSQIRVLWITKKRTNSNSIDYFCASNVKWNFREQSFYKYDGNVRWAQNWKKQRNNIQAGKSFNFCVCARARACVCMCVLYRNLGRFIGPIPPL